MVTGNGFVADDEGAGFAEQLSVMANSWKNAFDRGTGVIDPAFIFAVPSQSLASKIAKPTAIQGSHAAFEIDEWPTIRNQRTDDGMKITLSDNLLELLDHAVEKVY